MNTVFFLILRQMRAPLLLLSAVYAIATLGLTLIPGVDDQGNVFYMDFFHAFYFVSFMGTTIGFGEIPYAFTGGQRMWALMFLYITVATWIYTIGTLISLLSSETLRNAITEYRYQRQVANITEPFSLICGYGDSGSKLIHAMRNRRIPATVVEIKQDRIDALMLNDGGIFVPGLRADASTPDNLVMAGLKHPLCKHVVALTNNNAANLHIAITAKIMNPNIEVICRADDQDVEANMASFGTEHIIDPFNTFARDLGLATYAPHQFQLSLWLRSEPGERLEPVQPVPKGRWLLCGFGRFGQAIYREMLDHGLSVTVIEPDADREGLPRGSIIGDGTGEASLEEGGVMDAVGIIAGADDDSNNLSIIVTAKQMNPDLFVIVRQNEHTNRHLFSYSRADIAMEPSGVVARKIRSILTNDTINDFLSLARVHGDLWARVLSERIDNLGHGVLPETWELTISDAQTPAVTSAIREGAEVTIGDLLRDSSHAQDLLPAIVLFHASPHGAFCLPQTSTTISAGDKFLLLGSKLTFWRIKWILHDEATLEYVLTGETRPQTLVGKWLFQPSRVAAPSSTSNN